MKQYQFYILQDLFLSLIFVHFFQSKMDVVTMTYTVRYRVPITYDNLIEFLYILIKNHSKCRTFLFSN